MGVFFLHSAELSTRCQSTSGPGKLRHSNALRSPPTFAGFCPGQAKCARQTLRDAPRNGARAHRSRDAHILFCVSGSHSTGQIKDLLPGAREDFIIASGNDCYCFSLLTYFPLLFTRSGCQTEDTQSLTHTRVDPSGHTHTCADTHIGSFSVKHFQTRQLMNTNCTTLRLLIFLSSSSALLQPPASSCLFQPIRGGLPQSEPQCAQQEIPVSVVRRPRQQPTVRAKGQIQAANLQ